MLQGKWESFVNSLDNSPPPGKAWEEISRMKNQKTSGVAHPDPQTKASELINKYAKVSRCESLSEESISILSASCSERRDATEEMMKQSDECDGMSTQLELDAALSKGKSTAGNDGIHYGVIRLLGKVPGDPILALYYLVYEKGVLPHSWTESIIIPIPKPNSLNE